MGSPEMGGASTPHQEKREVGNQISGKELNANYAYQIAVSIDGIEEYKKILAEQGLEVDIFKVLDKEQLKYTVVIAIKDEAVADALEKTLFDNRTEGGFWGGTRAEDDTKFELIASFEKTN